MQVPIAFSGSYGGDRNYSASSANNSFTIGASSTTTTLSLSSAMITYPNTITLTATVNGSVGGFNPNGGNVTFNYTGGTLGTAVLSGNMASITIFPNVGSYTLVTAAFDGEAPNFLSSTSTTTSFTVAQASTTTSVAVETMTPFVASQPITFQSTTTGANRPSGVITWFISSLFPLELPLLLKELLPSKTLLQLELTLSLLPMEEMLIIVAVHPLKFPSQ